MRKRARGGHYGGTALFAAVSLFAATTAAASGLSGGLYKSFTMDFNHGDDQAQAVAIQPDGSIVVVGTATESGGTMGFAVARFNANGTLDTAGFNAGGAIPGTVITSFAGGNAAAQAVVIQRDGKIVVAGYATNSGGTTDFAVARYNPNGSLDTAGFNHGGAGGAMPGTVTTDFGFNDNDVAKAMALQPDGKIVVAGYTNTATRGKDFAVARYTTAGSLDATSFNAGKAGGAVIAGTAITDFGSADDDQAYGVVVQPDGKIVVSGYTTLSPPAGTPNAKDDFALARYKSDGTLDANGFNIGGTQPGTLTTSLGSKFDQTYAVALQPDGKILVAGQTENTTTTNHEFALARYDPTGTRDSSFGNNGITTTSVVISPTVSSDTAQALAVQPDGKIIAAGYSISGGTQSGALVRYDPNGTIDTTFNAGGTNRARPGTRLFDFGNLTSNALALALQPDGKIVVAGFTNSANGDDFAVLQYFANDSGTGWGLTPSTAVGFATGYILPGDTTATSGLLTVAGLGTDTCAVNVTDCVSVPVSVSGGAYAKNGSTVYTDLLGWARIGDQFNVQQTIPQNAQHGDKTKTTMVMGGMVAANNYAVILGSTTQYTFTSIVDRAPVISGSPPTSAEQGSSYTFTPTASDPDGDTPLTFAIDNPPTWANFDKNTGTLSGTPAAQDVGTSPNIRITVTDSLGESTSLPAFSIDVSQLPSPGGGNGGGGGGGGSGGGRLDPVTLGLLALAGLARIRHRFAAAGTVVPEAGRRSPVPTIR